MPKTVQSTPQTAEAQRRLRRALRNERQRRARQLAEGAEDRALLAEARAEGGKPVPCEEVKAKPGQ